MGFSKRARFPSRVRVVPISYRRQQKGGGPGRGLRGELCRSPCCPLLSRRHNKARKTLPASRVPFYIATWHAAGATTSYLRAVFVPDLIYNRKHNVWSEYIFAQLISFFNIYSGSLCPTHRVLLVSQVHTKGFGAPSPPGSPAPSPGLTNHSARRLSGLRRARQAARASAGRERERGARAGQRERKRGGRSGTGGFKGAARGPEGRRARGPSARHAFVL